MEDPRARLMQKWSSNLPAYDSSFLQAGDGFGESGEEGLGYEFLGPQMKVQVKKKSVARKVDEGKKKQGKGKKKQNGGVQSVILQLNNGQVTANSTGKKKKKPLFKRISKWNPETCESNLTKNTTKMNELYAELKTHINKCPQTVSKALIKGLQSIDLFQKFPNQASFKNSLESILSAVQPVLEEIKQAALRKRMEKTSTGRGLKLPILKYEGRTPVTSVKVDEVAVNQYFTRGVHDSMKYMKYLLMRLFVPCYRHLKLSITNHESEEFKAIAKLHSTLMRAVKLRDRINARKSVIEKETTVELPKQPPTYSASSTTYTVRPPMSGG
jgi:hypothetical protein